MAHGGLCLRGRRPSCVIRSPDSRVHTTIIAKALAPRDPSKKQKTNSASLRDGRASRVRNMQKMFNPTHNAPRFKSATLVRQAKAWPQPARVNVTSRDKNQASWLAGKSSACRCQQSLQKLKKIISFRCDVSGMHARKRSDDGKR